MRLTALFVTTALLAATPALGQGAVLDLSKPQMGTSHFVFDAVTMRPVQMGVPLVTPTEVQVDRGQASGRTAEGRAHVSAQAELPCGGKSYGDLSCQTAQPKTIRVNGYVKKDATVVPAHVRSRR